MARMTPKQIADALKEGQRRFPLIVNFYIELGDEINRLIGLRDRIDGAIGTAHQKLAEAAASRQFSRVDELHREIQKLLSNRESLEKERQAACSRQTLETRLQPLADGLTAALTLQPVLNVIQENWSDLDEVVASKISEAIGGGIAL